MNIEGTCRKCAYAFDAHWHQYPELKLVEAIMHSYCPYCKSLDVNITTDEEIESPVGDDYEEDL